MSELVFEVMQEDEGGFSAKAIGAGIFTQGDTWDQLRANVKDAVDASCFDGKKNRCRAAQFGSR